MQAVRGELSQYVSEVTVTEHLIQLVTDLFICAVVGRHLSELELSVI